MLKVLLAVDRSDSFAEVLKECTVDVAPKQTSLIDLVAKNSYHVILIEGSLDTVSDLKAADPRTEVILCGRAEADAIAAIKRGAAAYFPLPVDAARLQDTLAKIRAAVEKRHATGELEKRLIDQYTFCGVVGRNPQMLDMFSLITRIAPYYKTVLITGETGTGKELIAKAIHASSPWAKNPFMVCNSGALVEGLIESELFGHQKGAFTGATRDKIGLFEAAGDGTLFLDELGELPLTFQPHLLRVLQNGEFRRVGSTQPSRARCRVIAATNRDLAREVQQGHFREDLFFRVTPVVIEVPPLRDRKDDVPLLCRAILEQFSRRTEKRVSGISRPAQNVLLGYDWPGNVRELENVLEQAAMLTTESFIRVDDLPPHVKLPRSAAPLPLSLAEVEKRHIALVLQQCEGNRTKASAILGVSRRALLRKIAKFRVA